MGRLYYKVILIILVLSCCKKKDFYPFDSYFSESYYEAGLQKRIKAPPPAGSNIKINKLPGKRNFISGTASHHMLVLPVIDGYFKYLKENREVGTFIIVCPKHYDFTPHIASVSYLPWETGAGKVKVNRKYTKLFIKEEPLIKADSYSFHHEHGIGTLTPFIKKYFPGADIVQIAVDEKKKQFKISDSIEKRVSEIIKEDKDVFFLISADFSHSGGRALTDERDRLTEKYFPLLDKKSIFGINTDNSSGIYALFSFCGRNNIRNNHIFCHTDSASFTGAEGSDITSYFFSFQY